MCSWTLKSYKWAQNFEVFCISVNKNTKNEKKSWHSWQGYVKMTLPLTMSNGDDISRNKLHIHVREKISGDVTKGIFQTCHGSGVMQHIPWLVQCVLTSRDICLVRTISIHFFRSVPERLPLKTFCPGWTHACWKESISNLKHYGCLKHQSKVQSH